jgi:multicomponent Na+:H+ antiporter subunit G
MNAADLPFWAASIIVVMGSLFSFFAAVGVLRLPDLYTRMHAASKAGAVGSGLALLAVAVVSLATFDGAVSLRAVLGILFLLLTTPISAHLLARAAYRAGVRPHPITSINEFDTGPAKMTLETQQIGDK